MSKVLVTGSSGFLGKRLCELWEPRDELIKVDVTGDTDYCIDLCNTKEVRDLVELVEPDLIIHLAALSHVIRQNEHHTNGAYEMVGRNVLSTFNILSAAYDMCHVVMAGSAAEYGESDTSFPNEHDSCQPNEPYGISKYIGSMLGYWTFYDVAVLRFANLYGPGQKGKFIPRLLDVAIKGGLLTLNGSGNPIRQWLYVDDAIEAIRCVAKGVSNKLYNIGPTQALPIKELAIQIYEILQDEMLRRGRTPPIMNLHLDPENGGSPSVCMDSNKAYNELSWRPKVTLEQGLRKTIIAAIEEYDADNQTQRHTRCALTQT